MFLRLMNYTQAFKCSVMPVTRFNLYSELTHRDGDVTSGIKPVREVDANWDRVRPILQNKPVYGYWLTSGMYTLVAIS